MAEAPRITPEELNRRRQSGEDIVVLDLRRASYAESDVKIAGAIRIEPDSLEAEYERIPAGSTVVTYCT
jgi:rhodanese-related sulfurtransferase